MEEKAQASPQLKDMGELWTHTDHCGRLGWGTVTLERFCKKCLGVTPDHKLRMSQHHHQATKKATGSTWAR